MPSEKILTIKQLRESIFDNRKNKISLEGIMEYFRRNNEYYSLEETFEVNATILGAIDLYHGESNALNN